VLFGRRHAVEQWKKYGVIAQPLTAGQVPHTRAGVRRLLVGVADAAFASDASIHEVLHRAHLGGLRGVTQKNREALPVGSAPVLFSRWFKNGIRLQAG